MPITPSMPSVCLVGESISSSVMGGGGAGGLAFFFFFFGRVGRRSAAPPRAAGSPRSGFLGLFSARHARLRVARLQDFRNRPRRRPTGLACSVRSGFALGSAFLLLGCAGTAPLPPKALALNRAGAEALARGDLETADARLSLALEYSPRFVEALVNQGLVELQRGNFERARELITRARRLNAGRGAAAPRARQSWPSARRAPTKRHATTTKRSAVDPGFAPARANLARLLFDAGMLDEALVQFKRLSEVAPDSPEARTGPGRDAAATGSRRRSRGRHTPGARALSGLAGAHGAGGAQLAAPRARSRAPSSCLRRSATGVTTSRPTRSAGWRRPSCCAGSPGSPWAPPSARSSSSPTLDASRPTPWRRRWRRWAIPRQPGSAAPASGANRYPHMRRAAARWSSARSATSPGESSMLRALDEPDRREHFPARPSPCRVSLVRLCAEAQRELWGLRLGRLYGFGIGVSYSVLVFVGPDVAGDRAKLWARALATASWVAGVGALSLATDLARARRARKGLTGLARLRGFGERQLERARAWRARCACRRTVLVPGLMLALAALLRFRTPARHRRGAGAGLGTVPYAVLVGSSLALLGARLQPVGCRGAAGCCCWRWCSGRGCSASGLDVAVPSLPSAFGWLLHQLSRRLLADARPATRSRARTAAQRRFGARRRGATSCSRSEREPLLDARGAAERRRATAARAWRCSTARPPSASPRSHGARSPRCSTKKRCRRPRPCRAASPGRSQRAAARASAAADLLADAGLAALRRARAPPPRSARNAQRGAGAGARRTTRAELLVCTSR